MNRSNGTECPLILLTLSDFRNGEWYPIKRPPWRLQQAAVQRISLLLAMNIDESFLQRATLRYLTDSIVDLRAERSQDGTISLTAHPQNIEEWERLFARLKPQPPHV